ncbi:MAG: Protein of unknown function (DUF1016) [Verrucomicrobia bacterium]|nr:MAG: Protein of unknown function (DUF1016) [Verrucomicrobiota bacterium]
MSAKPKPRTLAPKPAAPAAPLLADVRELILTAQQGLSRMMNATLTLLYWGIGHRIRVDVLKESRAEYGEEIVQTLSAQLEREFGRGFSRRNLFNMVAFAAAFPDREIVQTLSAQLSWSHFTAIAFPWMMR